MPLVAAAANPTPNAAREVAAPTPIKQATLDVSGQQQVTKPELNTLMARYVVENMLPLSAVVSESFRAILAKIPIRGGGGKGVAPCRNTFAKFIDGEYEKMIIALKKSFEELQYVSTTADIWTCHDKSYLGVTAHWINPNNMEREKAALACRRFMGHHGRDAIAVELGDIHSTYGITHKITATVTDNGSNFVKAFKRYQPPPLEESDSEEDEDEVTFTDVNDALRATGDNDGDVITLPPHKRCASHTLHLISCTDVDKWLLSKSATKAVYRSATAKCTALWNKTSRSASETFDELVSKKLLVPRTMRWNSFYDALTRIGEISMVDLNAVSSKLGLTAITEREHRFLKEYCIAMKPLTVALDILRGEENCFHGTLLPTIETLMLKTEALRSGLQILRDLPDAIVTAIKTRFADVLGNEEAILAAVTLPKFKLRWLRSQELKDKAKASLLAECRRIVLEEPQQGNDGTSTRHHADSAKENDFFSFEEDEEETTSLAENQVADYIRSSAQNFDSLCGFSLIKKISLRYNAAPPSSAPVERLFSMGKLVFSPKRNRLSDKRFEKLLLLRYNHWFTC